MKKKVLISGGSGLIGQRLKKMLIDLRYEVTILSRSAQPNDPNRIQWDVGRQQIDASRIAEFNHIINLAGAGIVDKAWTEKRKKELIDSRVESTNLLAKTLKENNHKVESYVSASAVGYYGFTTREHYFEESDSAGNDFLSKTCKLWEESTLAIEELGIKTSRIRIGIVLAKEGGALKSMAQPIQYFLGAPLGNGKQYIPWIHIDDLCRMFIHAMENHLEGSYNAASPNQHNNRELSSAIAKTLKRPLWGIHVPAFMLKLILGSRALLVLEGSRVSVAKILGTGFEFDYPDLDQALSQIYA